MYLIAKKLKNSIRRVFIKFFLRSAYFSLFILALLGPSFGDIKKEVKTVGKDIFIAVDLSLSMLTQDIAPSRIEKLKFELHNLIKALPSDRIGIIIFSSEAVVHTPLTYDQDALDLFIETLTPSILSHSGTNLTAPINLAIEKFSEMPSKPGENNAKALILITDGEDFSSETIAEARKIKEAGISMIVLGIGSEAGDFIPIKGGYKKDELGNKIVSKLNNAYLNLVAKNAGGEYFEITPTRNEISYMTKAIQNLEGAVKDSKKIDVSGNKYYYFLIIGLVLIALDMLITIKTIQL